MMVPTAALRRVGLLDPLFGRGYCEEVDWNLRAGALGYVSLLAPGTFVFHRGQGSTVEAGLVESHQTSVAHNERVIDFRHPQYRSQLVEFVCSGVLPTLQDEGTSAIVVAAARRWGYTVEATALPRAARNGPVRFVADPQGATMAFTGHFCGFSAGFPVSGEAPLATLAASIGRLPDQVTVFTSGRGSDQLVAESRSAGVDVDNVMSYPERV
jgi:hypothetical protein